MSVLILWGWNLMDNYSSLLSEVDQETPQVVDVFEQNPLVCKPQSSQDLIGVVLSIDTDAACYNNNNGSTFHENIF